MVLVAGKGHEREQIVGTERLPFSDLEEIGKALRAGTNCGSCMPELKGILARERTTN